MPPRTARSPKRDSVSLATQKRLCTTAAALAPASSRVSRRRKDVVPQDAPEWQRMALKAAAAKLGKRGGGSDGNKARTKRGDGSSTASVAASRKSRSTTKKTTPNGRLKGLSRKSSGAGIHENEAAAAAASSPEGEREDVDGSASHAGSDESGGAKGGRGIKPRRGKGRKAAVTPVAKKKQRVSVADLVCRRCKLRMDQWSFCGLSGEAHAPPTPGSAAKDEDEKTPSEAASAVVAH
ncbi:hypothetical protein JKF63_05590 [Porcisia hertigi]|uniref:Uncharacterized protein n=1 Tax=Porcisia hertigi TaxID=2761500 RepID=A0A836L900_9TRYP|nr:hypothetical protein JKF63_05590 [Porcisia hertigi]